MKYVRLTLLVLAAVLVVVELRRALRTYLKFHGKMLVSCPETDKPAAVRVAAARAGWEAIAGNEELRLSECSRWRIGRTDLPKTLQEKAKEGYQHWQK